MAPHQFLELYGIYTKGFMNPANIEIKTGEENKMSE